MKIKRADPPTACDLKNKTSLHADFKHFLQWQPCQKIVQCTNKNGSTYTGGKAPRGQLNINPHMQKTAFKDHSHLNLPHDFIITRVLWALWADKYEIDRDVDEMRALLAQMLPSVWHYPWLNNTRKQLCKGHTCSCVFNHYHTHMVPIRKQYQPFHFLWKWRGLHWKWTTKFAPQATANSDSTWH